jgi:hypothetical protein
VHLNRHAAYVLYNRGLKKPNSASTTKMQQLCQNSTIGCEDKKRKVDENVDVDVDACTVHVGGGVVNGAV